MFRHKSTSRLQQLAAGWQTLGLMAVAFARHLLVLERRGNRSAYQKAEQLEGWVSAALCVLNSQIAEDIPAKTPRDRLAKQYLCMLFGMLSILLYVSRALKHRLRVNRAPRLTGMCAANAPLSDPHRQFIAPQGFAYLDSS